MSDSEEEEQEREGTKTEATEKLLSQGDTSPREKNSEREWVEVLQSVKSKAEDESERLHQQLEAALKEARTDHERRLSMKSIGALSPRGSSPKISATGTFLNEQKEARRAPRSPRSPKKGEA